MDDMELHARLQAIEITLAVLVRHTPGASQQLEQVALMTDAAPVPVSDAHLSRVSELLRGFAQGQAGTRWRDEPLLPPSGEAQG